MKLSYYPDTDSLYIDLTERASVESREISEGVELLDERHRPPTGSPLRES